MADRHFNLNKYSTPIKLCSETCNVQYQYNGSNLSTQTYNSDLSDAAIIMQSCIRGLIVRSTLAQKFKASALTNNMLCDLQEKAAVTIQNSWKIFSFGRNYAATKIQSYYRGWLMRRSFACMKQGIIKIQQKFRCFRSRRRFMLEREENASVVILQAHARGLSSRRKASRERRLIIKIQRNWRGWLQRKKLQEEAVRKIQIAFYCRKICKAFIAHKRAAIDIQRYVRGECSRKTFSVVRIQRWWRNVLKAKQKTNAAIAIQSHFQGWLGKQMAKSKKQQVVVIQRFCRQWLLMRKSTHDAAANIIRSAFLRMKFRRDFISKKQCVIDIQRYVRKEIVTKRLLNSNILLQSILKLQRWWRYVLKAKQENKSAVVIQSQFRGWMTRKMVKQEKQRVVVLQSYWKGYLARKDAKEQLLDLRKRMQKSATNVDDSKRLINRLVAALSELLNMRSVSNILNTCSTLDVATRHSQRCCEELVSAGAVGTLLQLICSVSRSIPDQEILKHALSTLRNLARYPHLTEMLIENHECIRVVLWEFLRNKEEGYFIAFELLDRICNNPKGVRAIYNFPALLKRFKNLVEELTRKSNHEKRNNRHLVTRELSEKRLRVAVALFERITTK